MYSNSPHKSKNNPSKHKKWFNRECRAGRSNFHLCKRKYSRVKNNDTKNDLVQSSKKYKAIIRKSVVVYKREMRRKIRSMRSKSPKDYWNYINSLNTRNKSDDVNMDVFFDFFKNLNANNIDPNERVDAEFPNVDIDHNLNNEITVEEIVSCINKYKSGEATGLDNVSDEY